MLPVHHPLFSPFAGATRAAAPLAQFLLGLQRDPGSPVLFGQHRLERVRIVIIERDDPHAVDDDEEFDDVETMDEVAGSEPELLPTLGSQRLLAPPRLVNGEILRGENGALYERFGQRIRPLRGLASGPRGEVLEIAAAPAGGRGPEPKRAAKAPSAPEKIVEAEEDETPAPAEPREPPRGAPESAAPFRALLAAPGAWRVLRLADVRGLLGGQLAHPERLRDSHHLPCYVQVYEATRPQSHADLATAALGDAARAGEFTAITPPLLQVLGLVGLLPAPRPVARAAQRPGWLLAGERVVHLALAHDPTAANTPAPAPAPAPTAPPASVAPVAPAVAAPAAAPALKSAVPAAFEQSARYAMTREDAVLALARPEGFSARVGRAFGSGAEARRRWQLCLSGRSLDEQLWGVPPPAGWRHQPDVLAWAEQALRLGNYELPAMLREWSVYWTRQDR